MSTLDPPPPPARPAGVPPRRNGLALAALIVGIVAVVAAVIPFLSYIAWLIGLVAVVLGIIALVRAGTGPKAAGIVGLILGAVAVLLSIVLSIVYTALFVLAVAGTATDPPDSGASTPSASESVPAEEPTGTTTPSAASRTVTYTVRGTGTATTISYLTITGGQSGSEQADGERLPWKKVVTIEDDGLFETSVFSLTAQNGGSGRITCEIEADGEVVSKHSSTGRYAVVSCAGQAGR